ncbi:MAG TPA: heme o synthase [Myxococcales bacterium]|nr:heme o synthase [Myxococcales bacterium]
MSTAAAYLELTKPRITTLVVFTTAAGLWLAPKLPSPNTVLLALAGTALVVASANALNMYLERDTDALMPRTMRRPLPSGRLEPRHALFFGLLLGAISVPMLTFGAGEIPGLLAAIALVSYVVFYTPMKRRTPASLLVGAVAGAMPPLIGWTAATGRIDLPGLLLFAVLFLWQVPHFLAITLFRRREFARAGLIVQANAPAGEREARRNIVVYTVALIAVSLMFIPLGIAGPVYLVAAVASGGLFLAYGMKGLRPESSDRWARNEFLGSVAYLTVLLSVLLLDSPHGF